jgi:hypothetical protein
MKQLAVVYSIVADDFKILYDFNNSKYYFTSEKEVNEYINNQYKNRFVLYGMIPYPTLTQMKKLKGV